jgi:hypothetical protein
VGEALSRRSKRWSYVVFCVLALAYAGVGIALDREADEREAELRNSITGEDSYIYFEPSEPGDLPNGIAFSSFFRKFSGKHSIQASHVTIDSLESGMVWDHEYGTVAPQEIGTPIEIPQLTFKTSNPKQTFLISMKNRAAHIPSELDFRNRALIGFAHTRSSFQNAASSVIGKSPTSHY